MEKCKNLPRVIQFPPDLIHLDLDYKTEIKAVVTQVLNGPGLFMIKFTAMYEKLCYYGIMRMDKVIYYFEYFLKLYYMKNFNIETYD